jgi:MFS transporter, ACS family, hexuronate transporter
MSGASAQRSDRWRYSVCGLLLLATMLNYMDRMTLAQLATTIQAEYRLDDEQYGGLEMGFGFAFAAGALAFGFLADRMSVRWLYPAVLLGWSLAGIATAYATEIGIEFSYFLPTSIPGYDAGTWPVAPPSPGQAYLGFLVCRIALGFFEAGHWPCALITTQVILTRKDRSFGNSILQSGAAIGAIITPIIVVSLLPPPDAQDRFPPGAWRLPFVAIGVIGMSWAVPWLALVRGRDLDRRRCATESVAAESPDEGRLNRRSLVLMFTALIVAVICLNLTWQFFRAWLPKFLEERRGYTKKEVAWFISAYYTVADVGCISVGYIVKSLAGRGWAVHRARMLTFAVCTAMTMLSLAVLFLPPGPFLVGVLLVVAAGALGLFPNYYSFAQEPSRSHQGKVTGSLGTIAWTASAMMQWLIGNDINKTKSYATGIVMAGIAPVIALAAMVTLWPRRPHDVTAAADP